MYFAWILIDIYYVLVLNIERYLLFYYVPMLYITRYIFSTLYLILLNDYFMSLHEFQCLTTKIPIMIRRNFPNKTFCIVNNIELRFFCCSFRFFRNWILMSSFDSIWWFLKVFLQAKIIIFKEKLKYSYRK